MKSNFKIIIPEPCNEDWDKMIPDATGRFCLECNKSVIDFTNKLPEEIQHFFLKNQDKEICGRFKNSQLDAVSIHIPRRVLFSQTQYHKMFLLALFVIMGTSLFSCATLNGDKQKIEKVEVVDEYKFSLATSTSKRESIIYDNLYFQKNTDYKIDSMPLNSNSFLSFDYKTYFLPENKKILFQPSTRLKNKQESNDMTTGVVNNFCNSK